MNIAIIIVNWNGGPLLLESVRSAVRQTLPAQRIVVVDNASTDGSLDALESWQTVEIIRLERNTGFAAANNLAVRKLDDCDWVALLNPDAIAEPDWLQQLALAVAQYPDAASFASQMIQLDRPELIDGIGDCYHFSGAVWRHGHGRRRADVESEYDREVFGACGGAAFYHRETFIGLGGFDESFFCYCEDIDLAFRLQLVNRTCWYIHKAKVLHKGGGTLGVSTDFADFHGHRNLIWTWVKNMPIALLLPSFPFHILANIAMLLMASLQGRGKAVLKGKLAAIYGLCDPLSKRSGIQHGRKISNWQLWQKMDKSLWSRK